MPCKFPGNYFSVDTHSNKIDGSGISSNGNGIFSVASTGISGLVPEDEHFAFELQDYYEEDFRHFTVGTHTDADGSFKGNLDFVSNDFYVRELGLPRVWKNYLGENITYRNSITTLSDDSASSIVFTCWHWPWQVFSQKEVTIEADIRFKYGSYSPSVARELFYINFVDDTSSYPGINEHASRAGANLTYRTDGTYGLNITYEPNGEAHLGSTASSNIHSADGYTNWLRVRVKIIRDPNPPVGVLECKESFTTTAGIYSLGQNGFEPETELITGKLDHTCDFNIWNKRAYMQIFTYGQTNGGMGSEFTIDKIKLSPLK